MSYTKIFGIGANGTPLWLDMMTSGSTKEEVFKAIPALATDLASHTTPSASTPFSGSAGASGLIAPHESEP